MTGRLSPKRAAEMLLARHHPATPPIDVEAIARAAGATVVRDALDTGVSGLLIRSQDSTIIAVNETQHPRRQRFTISHELGHLVLHPGREYIVDSTVRLNWRSDLPELASKGEERDANAFAANLLMPEAIIRDAIARMGSTGVFGDERTVQRLAKEFDVSQEAMNFRLINLGIAS